MFFYFEQYTHIYKNMCTTCAPYK